MADIKSVFGTATAFTITNANLATSATAGWRSNAIDNSTNLYLDALVHFELAAVNTAPANSKAIFVYGYALVDTAGSAYTGSGDQVPDGSEGTWSFPDVTANAVPTPLVGVIPYPKQNEAINAGPFSIAAAFGGILPPKWGIGMINHTGMTLSVTAIKYLPVYRSVA